MSKDYFMDYVEQVGRFAAIQVNLEYITNTCRYILNHDSIDDAAKLHINEIQQYVSHVMELASGPQTEKAACTQQATIEV